jgi:hypothetical protein
LYIVYYCSAECRHAECRGAFRSGLDAKNREISLQPFKRQNQKNVVRFGIQIENEGGGFKIRQKFNRLNFS